MRILFDQGVPHPLRHELANHEITTLADRGWSELTNGELLNRAESDGFACLMTTDQNLKYQQNLVGRRIGIVVLMSTSWPKIRERVADVAAALDGMHEGGFLEVTV